MKIAYLRTGGFTGLRLALDLDTSTMDARGAAEIADLVEGAAFFALPFELRSTTVGRDRFQYQLRVSESTYHDHQVLVDEDAIPAGLMPLLTRLTVLALKQGAQSASSGHSSG